jgi:hypothetical protein
MAAFASQARRQIGRAALFPVSDGERPNIQHDAPPTFATGCGNQIALPH